jgi:hypothetical protein
MKNNWKKNRGEIKFLEGDRPEAAMGGTSNIGFGSGYEKIKQIETFCVDRVSYWVY